MQSPTAARPTHCPSCGARIARPELSLCSYCATPLALGAAAKAADAATLQRLSRMGEHKDFAEANTWEPTEADDAPGAARSRSRGALLVAGGLALCALGLGARSAAEEPGPWTSALLALGLGVLLLGAWALSRARALLARVRSQPLLKRPAIVIDRRSTISTSGLKAQTIYFFSLQFSDGSAGEYSFLGRGSSYEVPAAGATGLACTRGSRLLEFLKLRV